MPDGAKGVAAKLKSPNMYGYADNDGLILDERSRLSVMLACGISLSYSLRGNCGSILARPALKWFFQVWIAFSAKFLRCV